MTRLQLSGSCRLFKLAFCPALVVLAGTSACLGQPGTPFPAAGLDTFSSNAIFRVLLIDGTDATSPLLTDPATVIGRSDPYSRGAVPPDFEQIFGGGLTPYANTAMFAPEPSRIPPGFPLGPATRREVRTEILNFDLQAPGDWRVTAGQAFFNSASSVGNGGMYRNSFGLVASHDPGGNSLLDFPAASFFNVYVEAQVPSRAGPMRLYNLTPMVLTAELDRFPPYFSLPQSNYIHDPRFPAVPLFNSQCLQVGWLVSAGHGGPDIRPITDLAGPAGMYILPSTDLSFCVAQNSHGLPNPPSDPNDVRTDFAVPAQQTTVYRRTGGFTNMRSIVGSTSGGGFQVGDTITGQSFGHDSTRIAGGGAAPGALYFSVSAGSRGKAGTDVRAAAEALCPRQGQGIFVTAAPAFGNHDGHAPVATLPANSNYLAADGSILGLGTQPGTGQQDDLKDFALDSYSAGRRWFGTMTGPSFSSPGDAATIWMYDSSRGDFARSTLSVFAAYTEIGLLPGDVISAMALSALHVQSGDPLVRDSRDMALFALNAGSPTLAALGLPNATVFQTDFTGRLDVFLRMDLFCGLAPDDEIDALDLVPIPNPDSALVLGGAGAFLLTVRRRPGR